MDFRTRIAKLTESFTKLNEEQQIYFINMADGMAGFNKYNAIKQAAQHTPVTTKTATA